MIGLERRWLVSTTTQLIVASSKGGIRDGHILSQMPIHPLCIKHYELREYRFWREDTGRPG
jgi:hypothetical protein